MKTLSSYFEAKKRDNGETYTTMKENRPEALYDAVYAAHDGMLPHEWIYAACRSACETIDCSLESSECDLSEIDSHEWADGEVDIYTSARFQWAAEFCNSNLFAAGEEYAGDVAGRRRASTVDTLGVIQYGALQFIWGAMLGAYHEIANEPEDDLDPPSRRDTEFDAEAFAKSAACDNATDGKEEP